MKKPLRIVLISVAVLAALAATAVGGLLANSHTKLHRSIHAEPAPVALTALAGNAPAPERGQYLYQSRGCGECHGADGAGHVFIDEPGGLQVRGANITRGNGSAVLSYTDRDWVRAVRHGIKPDGRPLFVMPSEDYNRMTDADLAQLVAHIRALPPKDAPGAQFRLPLIVKLVHGAGVLRDAAEKIDHRLPPALPVPETVSVEHGRYVAQACAGCHGGSFDGGSIPGAPPHWPPAARLHGEQGAWASYGSADQLKSVLRTGARPDGSQIHTAMPRNPYFTDTDIEAMYLFFRSLGTAP